MQFVEIESMGHEAHPLLTEKHYRNFCTICNKEIVMSDNKQWVHDDKR